MATTYTTVKVPDPLIRKVEDIINANPELGYRNRSEFIVEAIREKIRSLEPKGV